MECYLVYIKTNDDFYLDKAISVLPVTSLGGGHTHCWDDVSYGAALKIAQVTKDEDYAAMVERNLDFWLPGGGITYTPGGLAWLSQWGSLRYASTAAFLAFVWSDDDTVGTISKKDDYRNFAERQINYALGDNPRNGSYVVGYGENAPKHPHHRTAHGSWTSQLSSPTYHRNILYGALVGGPTSNDSWEDDITDYMLNEVATDYNAGFVGALAKMYDMYGGEPLKNWPQPEDFIAEEDDIIEYFTRCWIVHEGHGRLNLLFQVNNRSTRPATMKDKLSCRYYMDLTEVFEAGYGVEDVKLNLASHEGAKLSGLNKYKDNIYYFIVDFTGTQIMPSEWQMCEKDANVEITLPGGIESFHNDWSYQNLTGSPDYSAISFKGLTPYIPVYDDGVKIYGLEPGEEGDISPTPTPIISPTVTPTPHITPTVTPSPTVTPTPPPEGPTPTVTPIPTPTDDIKYEYKVENEWWSGLQGQLVIENNSSRTYNGWTLTFDYKGTITDLWGAELISQTENKVTIKNPFWKQEFAPGEKLSIGFIASIGSDKEAPTNYSFE